VKAEIANVSRETPKTGSVREIGIDLIGRNPDQPRECFDDDKIRSLAASMAAAGLIQPIIVRPVSDGYQIVAGERRWRAAQRLGWESISCLVRDYSAQQMEAAALIENIKRQDLNAIEEARAFQRLIQRHGLRQKEAATRIGVSRAKIANALRLLDLPQGVQGLIVAGELEATLGRAIAGAPREARARLATEAVQKGYTRRQLEARIAKEIGTTDEGACSDADVKALERALTESLGSRTTLVEKGQGGEIRIRYTDLDVLEGLLERLRRRG
jgi:ParB family chromosome partitioning protein